MNRRVRRSADVAVVEAAAEISDLASDGRGVGRIAGKVVLVAGALPGERVRLRMIRRRRTVDHGVLLEIERPSPDRVVPECIHFDRCGGCMLQHLAPAAQLAFKQKQVLEALARLGRVVPQAVAAPLRGPVWAYRRRARLGVDRQPRGGAPTGDHTVRVGFRERERPRVMRLQRCEILDPRVGPYLAELAEVLESLAIRDHIPQIEVAAGDAAVALVVSVLRPPGDDDRARLAAFGRRHDFRIHLQAGGPEALTPMDGASSTLHYSPDGSALSLAFGATDFIQVNGQTSQAMVRQALAWLAPRPQEPVLELFAGLGNFGLPLAAAGATVTAVEGDGALVARGRANAARHGLQVKFVQADLFAPDASATWLQARFGAVLLDPPRAGAREVLPLLAARRPGRLLYVSCHPASLARDAGVLVHDHGYVLRRLGVVDMFPHTAHVESMALFESS